MQRYLVLLLIGLVSLGNVSAVLAEEAKPSLDEALASLKVPPDWFKEVSTDYDLSHPWKEARLKIRELLGEGRNREAIKLTYLYAQKNDIGDGHELPMYVFMGGEYAWAVQEYRKFLATKSEGATHAFLNLAACYRHFGEYDLAIETLNRALTQLPDPPWRIFNHANVEDALGDIYAELGKLEEARKHYRKAMELYPTSDQPYGRHELHRRVAKIQSKLDLMDIENLDISQLRDGKYTGKSIAYAGEMTVIVTIQDGKITHIDLKHKEKIDQGATRIIPARIIEKQSLKVDGITGATVTYQAILDGALQALRAAGLQ